MNCTILMRLLAVPLLLSSTSASSQISWDEKAPEPAKEIPGKGISRNTGQALYHAENGKLIPSDSVHFSYGSPESRQPADALIYRYSNGAWMPSKQYLLAYDGNNRLKSSILRKWDAKAGTYRDYSRRDYTYNEAGEKAEDLHSDWDTRTSAWVNRSRSTLRHETSGTGTSWISESRNYRTGAWEPGAAFFDTHNAQGKRSETIARYWKPAEGSWGNTCRFAFGFDRSGAELIADTFSSWDQERGTWYRGSVTAHSLRPSGKRAGSVTSKWNSDTKSYEPVMKTAYGYDAAENQVSSTRSKWSANGRTFLPELETRYTYNSYGQKKSGGGYNMQDGRWTPAMNHCRYYYETTATPSGVTPLGGSTEFLSLLPNPAGNRMDMTISWTQPQSFSAAITDLQGRIMQQFSGAEAAEHRKVIDTEGLSSGSYMLSVTGAKSGTVTRTFTVAH